jgi:hypothetical protein
MDLSAGWCGYNNISAFSKKFVSFFFSVVVMSDYLPIPPHHHTFTNNTIERIKRRERERRTNFTHTQTKKNLWYWLSFPASSETSETVPPSKKFLLSDYLPIPPPHLHQYNRKNKKKRERGGQITTIGSLFPLLLRPAFQEVSSVSDYPSTREREREREREEILQNIFDFVFDEIFSLFLCCGERERERERETISLSVFLCLRRCRRVDVRKRKR